ncbi:hypothetical protein HPB49_000916 [Dermacentor silvarum]|uniref:Uncharacterized protein n=1 Tax=Dermacentor silvarum TaxID=543639 RepID=A0ACB8D9G3_DERSI|nr:hypothetical protein HPB49_000916 [Dermacentor silvarum]
MVRDVAGAFSNSQEFADIVVDWAIKNGFDGVELDMPEGTAPRGYDALAQALSKRMALATQLWILSANVYTTPSFANQVDLQALHRAVDFLVLNTEYLSRDDQVTSAHSPLYGKNSWMLFIAAHRLLGVALKQLGLDAFRASPECGPQPSLFDAVATQFRQFQRSGEGKMQWKSSGVRLTVVRESGTTSCVGIV